MKENKFFLRIQFGEPVFQIFRESKNSGSVRLLVNYGLDVLFFRISLRIELQVFRL